MLLGMRVGLGVLLGATALQIALAIYHPLLADEALYWVWAQHLAAGYYDQPPLFAWVLAGARIFGEGELWLRLPGILATSLAPLTLLRYAGDRDLWLLWWSGLPPLFFLGLFATPDALLLPLWCGALAAALRGGRGWLLAGLLCGLAFLTKYTALALLPLLILAADPAERRTPWPWLGALLAGLVALPNLVWNAQNGWVTFGFQASEGIFHPHAPGLWGPLWVLGQQVGILTPVAALAAAIWLLRRPIQRTERMAWASSAPLLLFFALAAVGGPPDGHWPAPAWIGVGLGLSHSVRRLHRLASVGAWLAAMVTLLIAIHSVRPLIPLPDDPRLRLQRGPLLAELVARWVSPEPGAAENRAPPVIFTERYQEAAWIHYYAGIPARVFPGCGRKNQYDLWDPGPLPGSAWMLRPTTGGPDLCTDGDFPLREGPHLLRPLDASGAPVGSWQLFRIERP